MTKYPTYAEAKGSGWFWWVSAELPPEYRYGGGIPPQAKGPFASLSAAQDEYRRAIRQK